MSDLYRSAIHARIAKLPSMIPAEGDEDEESEAADSLGSLPSDTGPPHMQVSSYPQALGHSELYRLGSATSIKSSVTSSVGFLLAMSMTGTTVKFAMTRAVSSRYECTNRTP